MSDLEDDFMQMSEDEEDFSFEYDEDDEVMDDDAEENQDNSQASKRIDYENMYYSAKAAKEEDIQDAITQFELVIQLPVPSNQSDLEYLFKSIKQLLKLYHHSNQFDKFTDLLPKLFEILPQLNDKSYGEESITKLISHYDKSKSDTQFLTSLFDNIIKGVISTYQQPFLSHGRVIPQDRLWINLNLRRASLIIRNNSKEEALTLLKSLQQICENSSETIKGSYMLEIIALQIRLYSEKPQDFEALKRLYHMSFEINSAVPHPKIMGIVKECGGEIYMKQANYYKASNEFYESFKNYDELGDERRIQMLKKLMISNMLSETEINPFHSKEFQSFVKLPELQEFLELHQSFVDVDIAKFNDLIDNHSSIFDVCFADSYVEELKTIIQSKTIVKLSNYYNSLELSYLSELLRCDIPILYTHVLKLISSGKMINLKINFEQDILEIKEDDHFSILPNLEVEDIVNYIKEMSKSGRKVETDKDGDHLMEEPISNTSQRDQQPQQHDFQNLKEVFQKNRAVKERPESIRLNYEMIQSLNLILGNLYLITSKDQEQQREITIYDYKLESILKEWISILKKCLPLKTNDNLSQIEQVKMEQQQQQQQHEDDKLNDEIEQETAMGDLRLEKFDFKDEEPKLSKTDGVSSLIKSIGRYQEVLLKHYEDKSTFAQNLLDKYEQ